MSKICISILTGSTLGKKQLKKLIEEQLAPHGLAVFFELSYIEPFLEEIIDKSPVFFSIADTHKYDNCEMLLLPDNCSINGKENNIPFCERVKLLKDLLSELLKHTSQIDVFAGDSGLHLCDFKSFQINIDGFQDVFNQLNSVCPIDLHITVQRSTGDSST